MGVGSSDDAVLQGEVGAVRLPPSAADAAAMAAIRAHPRYRETTVAFAREAVALYRGNRFLNVVANDRGRFFVAILAMRMDAEPEGLTAARLAAACTTTGLCSPGRARALLRLMQWSGHLRAEGARLRPTAALIGLHRERLAALLPIVAALRPEIAAAPAAVARDAYVVAFCAAQAGSFLAGTRLGEHAPALAPFGDRNAGLLVLFCLYLAASGQAEAAPSVAALARRFHLSRAHVLAMLRDAEAAGLVRRRPDGGPEMTPALGDALDAFFPVLLHLNATVALAALRAVG